jgi:hypothetical protein
MVQYSLPDLTMPDAEDENEIEEDRERKEAWPSINLQYSLVFALPYLTMPDAEDEDDIEEDHERKEAWPSINESILSA